MTVSVIMGIYNCEPTLADAIESLLSQTYRDWELIMCDDGSTDGTYSVAEQYEKQYPGKIKLLRNPKNMGLGAALNRCLAAASGEYIARMDGDDLSLPDRLEKEAAFLDAHPEYAIVSCPMVYFDENGDWGEGSAAEWPDAASFIRGTPFCHAPCMVRREAYAAVDGYSSDPRTLRAEDYDLWFRMYEKGFKGCNLQEALYKMRDDQNAYKRRKLKYALNETYVRMTGYKRLRLPIYAYVFAVRPILVSMIPQPLYMMLHQKIKRNNQ